MTSGLVISQPGSTASKPLQSNPCIHELFAAQAASTPDAIAVCCGDEKLTYAELDEKSNQLARFLIAAGLRPEMPAALYLERSVSMVVAILGVLKAGGAYVPIDLAYPQERLAFMLEDTNAPVLLTQKDLATRLPNTKTRVICLDAEWPNIAAEDSACLAPRAASENVAYIIYTSGSTGKPKGVIVTHHNVVRLLQQTAPWYQFDHNDVWPLFHSYAFDVSVWELWGSLFNGGRLVVVPYMVTRSPADFYQLLAREGVTVLNQTPSAFRQLIWAEQMALEKLPLKLRYVICAGEALELQSLKPWFELHGDERPRIVNMYGITETTVHSTYRVIRAADLTSGVGSVIGVPIPDLHLHLVDENLKPVPAGTPGEICVGGAGVARGYLNRPELTSQRFLSDSFSGIPGARLYRSGDLAVINPQGEMEYLGRMDHQVKIRGFRVELGEIESALNRHPQVRESVVIAQDSPAGDKRLVAYIVPRSSSAPSVSDLRDYLAPMIPDYMIPALFVTLKSLPLTTNGKVDRRALPAPETARPNLRSTYVAPTNALEQTLAHIWQEVLGIDQVGIHDNYFELGGDSIRSIRILAKAQEKGWHLTLEQVFGNPTVAGLAACAKQRSADTGSSNIQPFSLVSAADRVRLPDTAVDAYPIAKLQLGMFYYNELDPVSAMYHDVFSYRINAPFEESKLRESLQALVARHPMLRTSFHLAGYSQPLQIVHRTVPPPFTMEDLRSLSVAEQDKALIEWVETEKRHAFDRTVPPLCRFHVQWRNTNEFQFILSFHHCSLDGWSLAAVITEIFRDYSARLSGKAEALPPVQATYREFVSLEQAIAKSSVAREFWAKKIGGAPSSTLARWPKSMRVGGHEQMRGPELNVPAEVLNGLKALAHSAGVPLKTVLLAAHQRVMALLYGQDDVTSGLVSNGRPETLDGEKLVGLFLNTLPLRMQLNGGSWKELVRETFKAEQELMPHRRMPLAEIQKLNGGQPLFEAAFDFVHFHVYKDLEALRSLDLAEGHYFEANNLTTYTTLMLDVNSTKLEVHIDYDPNSIARPQVEEMTRYYLNTFAAMAGNPDGDYHAFSPLSPQEQDRLLNEWNATENGYPANTSIDQLVAEQAARQPNKIAVVFGRQQLTYGELMARAEAVASALRRLGAGRDKLVGLCVERSADMLVALLGVLRAGGAYVPLDPAYPRDRLQFMLEDSAAEVVLTQRSLLDLVPKTAAVSLCIEDLPVTSVTASPGNSATDASAESLAYVIYTSGSTGKPKGVQVTHRSVINLLSSAAATILFGARDNLLAVTTLSFDIAGLELWMPLVNGATVTVASRETAGNGTELAGLIADSNATVMQGTPATWRLLIESGWKGKPGLKIICGGEALKQSLADELIARGQAVWNFYGPTETTIWSTASRVASGEPITIGRPLANTQLYILNKHLQPVPIGVSGELHIGGHGVARGYLNRPELTAERFIPNPFAHGLEAGATIYNTGDLARYLPDGRVDCVGRVDHQVKIRGFRIELGEVETALRQHASIAEALVTATEDGLGERRLVGYVISKNGPPSAVELRDFLRSKLPPYMVPAQFVTLKQFPLTPNGKVDLKQLPRPDGMEQSSHAYVAPRSTEEIGLAEIWQEVLMVNKVGIDDDFFELGGDSLSATRAYARANKAFGMALTLREMLDRPTIRSLAELVSQMKGTAPQPRTIIPRQPRAIAST